MSLDITEADVIEPIVEKAADAVKPALDSETRQIEAFEKALKRVESIISGIERMTSYSARQQQPSQTQSDVIKIGREPQQLQAPQQPAMAQQPTQFPPIPSEPDEPELTGENFKDYFDSPTQVITMLEKVLAALPDKILLSQAATLLQQNLQIYGKIEAKEARKQVKAFRPLLKMHLKQFFPKDAGAEQRDVSQRNLEVAVGGSQPSPSTKQEAKKE